MFQESDDKLKGTARSDTAIFIALIAAFFLIGGVATALKTRFDSPLPIYAAAAIFAVLIYLIYKLRIVGWRY
ncbi:MAG: hypothetical protein J6P98_03225, partial [Clostridia bacterium]|nr:hypothetical protein [Clostridia bacterium]